jgi:mannosylglucosylglycerate synthase
MNNGPMYYRIVFISGKLGDVDGVSLEVDKWIDVLSSLGHEVFTIAGKYGGPIRGVPEERQYLLDMIHFDSSEQKEIEKQVFPYLLKDPPYLSEEGKRAVLEKVESLGSKGANVINSYIQDNDIDLIIAENTNAMPMTLIGGMAVYKLAVEKRIAALFHHHDFWWERSRFSHSHIDGLLNKIMPPVDPGLEHVVLSSYSAHILRSLKRVHPRVIPNCEDFDNPVTLDGYNSDFRREFGFRRDDVLVVQPTRIVRRKRIEDSLELLHKLVSLYPDLHPRVHFIVSLYQGDEPDRNYIGSIRGLAERYNIPMHLIANRVASERKISAEGKKIYTNRDVLANADFVTYLPVWEGFGNALLEAMAARAPVATTTYLVYKTDIKIMGFRHVEIHDVYEKGVLVIPDKAVEDMYNVITDPILREEIVRHNFQIGKESFGLPKLHALLKSVITEYAPEIHASRRRIEKSKMTYSV